MKIQKISISIGLLAAIFLLAGCGQTGFDMQKQESVDPVSVSAPATTTSGGVDNSQVSTQPGTTADEEINNIDKDLKAIDDTSLNQGLSDVDLGL